MKTFYFNTGVKPENVINFPYDYHAKQGHVIRGTLLIPFDCEDVPEGAAFKFACSNPDLEEGKNMIVRKIHNSSMASDYAYFTKPYKI